jgi:hypothetical protein
MIANFTKEKPSEGCQDQKKLDDFQQPSNPGKKRKLNALESTHKDPDVESFAQIDALLEQDKALS